MSVIIIKKVENFAVIKLNRPEKFNSFNAEMAEKFQTALDDLEKEDELRALVITGEGKAFSAGQDLGEVLGNENFNIENAVANYYNPIIRKIRNSRIPIIAAVNGVAAGAGANIALACDITVASSSASFIQAFSKIGLVPDSGGTWFLPRLIGFQRASALMMTGEKVDAHKALEMGMIFKVFSHEDFESSYLALAHEISTLPTKGLYLTKLALNHSFAHSIEEQLALEQKLQSEAGTTQDYAEGINAFIEKRPPKFTGK